jgi:transcription-repair coupling factor (superfamily II helicase)
MTHHLSPLSPKVPSSHKTEQCWGKLYGNARGLAIANTAKSYEGIIVVITPDVLSAAQIECELRFFLCGHLSTVPVFQFPDLETLPYDLFSPHQDIISERLKILSQLPLLKRGILIVSVTTLMHHLPPSDYLSQNTLMIHVGQSVALLDFRRLLEKNGYHFVSQVMEHGEFACRGSIIDLYPMGAMDAYRIDWSDDEIDSIRIFEPETQQSVQKINEIVLLPMHEVPLNQKSISFFRERFREQFEIRAIRSPVYQEVSDGHYVQGLEYYLPLFFEKTAQLFDYVSENSLIVCMSDLQREAEQFWQEIHHRYDQLKYDITRPILSPEIAFSSPQQTFEKVQSFLKICVYEEELKAQSDHLNFATVALPHLNVNYKLKRPVQALQDFLSDYPGRVLFCAETVGRRESLFTLLETISLHPTIVDSWQAFLDASEKICITVAQLDRGLMMIDPKVILITEAQLFEERVFQRRTRKREVQDAQAIIQSLTELHVNDPIVHIDHGVGRFLGLKTIQVGNQVDEYLTLQYADDDKLYVPVSALHLVNRYSGDLEHAPLHRLGSNKWEKAKRKAAARVRDVAAELLEIYARRSSLTRKPFVKSDKDYLAFVQDFPFEETPDQTTATDQIIADMQSEKPMDRLVCGDVGFGKTEVAMRAAFITVQNNKQVSVLVPTTLLAKQHYQSFKDRFADWPVKISMISRFQTTKEQHQIVEELKNGQIDIIIGTHKLLQKGIQFHNLGLLVIDEEHRFGVRQKERLKSLRFEVDILTLTATPIPRTLNLSFSGIRDLSIIATPPARRLSVKTFIYEYNPSIVREAVLREISRGGQVYYLYNKVEGIEKVASQLRTQIPEAKIGVVHGQMRKKALEHVMVDFYRRQFNVLVCTTIIESGIDIPSVNTMIIDRADTLGLAQLHQLRGRVGRSYHQAYAYLFIPSKENMKKDAQKRLEAIAESGDLGAGFMIATHDMEIRGAGELLGAEQSGHIQEIGFNLYAEMLERAVKALKRGIEPDFDQPDQKKIELNLQICALIPEDYLPDVQRRLVLYKRIANAQDDDTLDNLRVEMIDRFGLLPKCTQNLFEIASLKLKAISLGIKKIEMGPKYGRIEFHEKPNIDAEKIIQLVQSNSKHYQLIGSNCLRFVATSEDPDELIQQIRCLLE